MKVVMVVATSKDGFIASNEFPHPDMWTSPEDKKHLRGIVSKHSLLIIGKNTYETYGKNHSKGTLRLILTRSPEKYASDQVPGELEFVTMTPEEIVAKYNNSYGSCLILGGSYVYESFLSAGLVDEIYLTVEPVMFHQGIKVLSSGKNLNEAFNLPEPDITKLNEKGSLLKHYVLKK